MFEIKKVENYRQFAEFLEKETGCSIIVELRNREGTHVHFQINDRFGMSLGVLCVDTGDASFAPFEALQSVEDNQFINTNLTFRDITTVKKVFKKKLMNIYHVRIAYPV